MITVEFDGGCWPNPGGVATCGVYITDGDKALMRQGFSVGSGDDMSNNVAEYAGLIHGLQFLKKRGFTDREIIVRGDSKLVINQMSGRYKIKKGLYVDYALKAKKLVAEFSDINFAWCPRDDNEIADSLAENAPEGLSLEIDINSPVFQAVKDYMILKA